MGKRIFADALVKILSKRTLSHVTIADICGVARLSRKTFYYHFHDIYDLLEWVIREAGRSLVEALSKEDSIEKRVHVLFRMMEENRIIIINAYHSVEHAFLEKEFNEILLPLVSGSFSTHSEYRDASEDEKEFLCKVFTHGLTGIILHWFGEDMKPVPESYQMHFVRLLEGRYTGIGH